MQQHFITVSLRELLCCSRGCDGEISSDVASWDSLGVLFLDGGEMVRVCVSIARVSVDGCSAVENVHKRGIPCFNIHYHFKLLATTTTTPTSQSHDPHQNSTPHFSTLTTSSKSTHQPNNMHFPTSTLMLTLLASLSSAAPLATTVRVQLNGLSELAVQREVPINNAAFTFSGKFTDGFISNLNGNAGVTCQAYSDAAATVKVGGRFGTGGVKFNAGKEVMVKVLKCRK